MVHHGCTAPSLINHLGKDGEVICLGRRKKKPRPVSDKEALAAKPVDLPEDVEPELMVHPPRPYVWVPRVDFVEPGEKQKNLLINGLAVTGWVVRNESYWEGGYEAGPVYDITYCFEYEGKLYYGEYRAEFDGLHLAYGSPEYASWLGEAFEERKTFTVLFDKEDPENNVAYGGLELFVKKGGKKRVWAAR